MATTAKARVTLGKRPDKLRRTVTGPMPDGSDGLIEIDFKYRTRVEYGELLDRRMAEARASDEAAAAAEAAKAAQVADGAPPPMPASWATDAQRRSRDATAAHILDIATGWGLPEPFDLEHVTQLCDELPGMAAAIVDDYRAAVLEGRRGN